ncbi:sigma-54-dependent transcriptional regulator [Fibrobacterota bacterium]
MEKKGKILVADDESSLRILLSDELTRAGYSVDLAADGEETLKKTREKFYNVVLLDIVMPKKDGLAVLSTMKKENIPSEIIILTGNATLENAIESMKLGAFEYIKKPYSLKELLILIERAITHQRFQIDMRMLKQELRKSGYGGRIIGTSKPILDLRKFIARVAPSQSTVLILGESGSGKELVARAIHNESPLKNEPFITINCASLSETLLESELFGYEKGAFTDAKAQKRGLAEVADGGTLFLDEIGEIPLRFQAKLLRFLETSEIRRVGGTKDISLDVRIICATNKPLEELVAKGEFRSDLYYRLNVLSITVPPLRNHREDIPLLVDNILMGQAFNKEFDEEAMGLLMNYQWPGNVRELKNVIERSCVLCTGNIVTADDLSFLEVKPRLKDEKESTRSGQKFDISITSLKEMERKHIVNVLKYVNGHKGRGAKLLEINPKTLYYKMKKYNITVDYK